MLLLNSVQKTTWKQYGFMTADEQINMIYAVMLYIMEQSLKEESCTMDDIGAYVDSLNTAFLEKPLSYEECRQLGDFIVNVVLSNEGRAMYFEGYDFEKHDYQRMHISYVANRVIYTEGDIKRTSYYLTDDGYNLMLSTLEIENNMKLTIHEMIFHMHLEKQNYDRAVDEIKNVFQLLRIQLQKMREAMEKIRRNALNYTVTDYQVLLNENMETMDEAKKKFLGYRELVKARVQELEESNINVKRLSKEEEEKLENLQLIGVYLNRTIDELQRILSSHFDLKALYTRELEALSQMSLIKRFSFRSEFYDKILEDPGGLEELLIFLRPLFQKAPEKIYQLNKALEYQRPGRKGKGTESGELLDFDEESWLREQEEKRRRKKEKCTGCLNFLLKEALLKENGEITLEEIASKEEKKALLPDVETFKEVMVELLKNRSINIPALRKERSENITESTGDISLNELLLDLSDREYEGMSLKEVQVYREENGKTVVFPNVPDGQGGEKTIRCSDVRICVVRREGEERKIIHGI